jgi:hypothetical protein
MSSKGRLAVGVYTIAVGKEAEEDVSIIKTLNRNRSILFLDLGSHWKVNLLLILDRDE